MKKNSSDTPEEQLRQALTDNLAAFRGFAQSRLGNPELAADVVQDALLKALRARDTLRDDEMLVAWFYRILRNAIVDLHRKKAAEARALERFASDLDQLADAESEQMICGCLTRLLPTMKPGYAELVRRIDLDGQSPSEVAASLALTPGNLKVRLHRSRQQLKERLLQSCQLCATHGCLNCNCEPTEVATSQTAEAKRLPSKKKISNRMN